MTEQISGVPEGWRLVAVRKALAGEYTISTAGIPLHWQRDSSAIYTVITKIRAPIPTYRPFADAAEFKPHRDKWLVVNIKNIHELTLKYLTISCRNESIATNLAGKVAEYHDRGLWIASAEFSWEAACSFLLFEDGSPCGVKQ